MSQKNLVFQVQVPNDQAPFPGHKKLEYVELLYEKSKKSCLEYAEKVGADYFCLTDKSYLPNKHSAYQRFLIFEMNEYERIFYIDSDAIIQEACPNFFELEFTGLAAVPDFDDSNAEHVKRKLEISRVLKIKNPFCDGIFGVNKDWRSRKKNEIFKLLSNDTLTDQEIMNIAQGNEDYLQLSSDWGAWYKEGKFINHYAAHRKKEFKV